MMSRGLSWRMVLLLAVSLAMTPALAEEFARGQALYENHCQSCHAEWAHSRAGRKVGNLSELRRRVSAWSVHAALDWSDEDIGDVADYLDRTFYRFADRP